MCIPAVGSALQTQWVAGSFTGHQALVSLESDLPALSVSSLVGSL
jgi:hypothetical protein